MPLVSIIIPTRNRPLSLRSAIQSVLAQTLDDWELIIIDDASAQETAHAIAESIKPNVRSFRFETQRGGAAARNAGIAASQGRFIAFLDDDDAWEPTKLQEQIESLQGSGSILSYTGKRVLWRRGLPAVYSFKRPGSGDIGVAIMADNFIGTTSCVVVDTRAIVACGGFDESLPALQDWDLSIRLLRRGTVVGIDKPLVRCNLTDTADHVSFNGEKTRQAAKLLLDKYRADALFPVLRRGVRIVYAKKALKSRRFFWGYLCALWKGIFARNGR